MNLDIFNIVINKTYKSQLLSLEDYKDIINILIRKNELEKYVKKHYISTGKSSYNYFLSNLNINISDIYIMKKQHKNLTDREEVLCFENFYSLFPIFHEINHVIHEKRLTEDKDSIESKVLALSIYGTLNGDLENKAKTASHLSIYNEYHDLFIQERLANIESVSSIWGLSSFLDSSYDKVHSEILLALIKYYTFGYDEHDAPSKIVFEKLGRLDLYESILEITKYCFIGEKIRYGLEVPEDERNEYIYKLYSKLKRC